MSTLYIAADRPGAGKTALAAALGAALASRGQRVVLARPLAPEQAAAPGADAAFYRQVAPSSPIPHAWPLPVGPADLGDSSALAARVRDLVGAISQGGSTLVVEGLDGLGDSDPSALASAAIARAMDATVLLLLEYRPGLGEEEGRQAVRRFGGLLAGAVVNRVPLYRRHDAEARLAPALAATGVRTLGLVPEDRRMLAPTVEQVAQHLEARVLVPGEMGALVEHFMAGGTPLDNGAYVFSRRQCKAVIVRGDRPDLQMAALETSTACLVLTCGREPVQYVAYHAQERRVPVLAVQTPTAQTMESLHTIGGRVGVHSALKAQRFWELLSRQGDPEAMLAPALAP